MQHTKTNFQNCLVILNPRSSHAERAASYLKQLKATFPDAVTVCELKKGQYTDVIEALQKVTDTTLICTAGGDGTVNLVINTLLLDQQVPKQARQATIMPLWTGNANDLAFMTNGRYRKSLKTVLATGQRIAVHPILVSFKPGGDLPKKLAMNYVSFGAIAYISQLLNKPGYHGKHKNRLWQSVTETVLSTKGLLMAKKFSVEMSGEQLRMYDFFVMNGSRIAKVYRFPANLAHKEFYAVQVKHKHPLVLNHVGGAWFGLLTKRASSTRERLRVHDTTWVQLDGEAWTVPPGTDISVDLHSEPIFVLSTKLGD